MIWNGTCTLLTLAGQTELCQAVPACLQPQGERSSLQSLLVRPLLLLLLPIISMIKLNHYGYFRRAKRSVAEKHTQNKQNKNIRERERERERDRIITVYYDRDIINIDKTLQEHTLSYEF